MVQYPTTDIDRAFTALADVTRREVLVRLSTGSLTITELAQPYGMSLTGMKKHIRVLEDARLVTTEKVGRARVCHLVPYAFEGISVWLARLDRFAQVVERTKDVMSSPSDRERARPPQLKRDDRRAGVLTVELEEALSEHRNGT